MNSQCIQALEITCAALAEDNAKLRAKAVDLEGRSRRNNIRILSLPESLEGPRPTTFLSELLVEVMSKEILQPYPKLDRAQKPEPRQKPRSVVTLFHRFQTKELVIREARKQRGKLQYRGHNIHFYKDYTPEVLEQRAKYKDVMVELYKLGCKPTLLHPARLLITTQEEAFSPPGGQ